MILKNKLIEIAKQARLSPHVIEKDYVLGWVLYGIGQSKELQESWIFKGGTCLKKCYFNSYRMSEDLDFTLTNPSHLDATFLKATFSKISQWVYKASGIIIPEDRINFEFYENPRGKICGEGKLFYQGPLAPTSPRQTPRIKLDLSADEILVEPPVLRSIAHAYSDKINDEYDVRSYSYLEIFAEKIRALSERTRPRDLYDVIHFFRRAESSGLADEITRVLAKKCDYKSLPFPTLNLLQNHKDHCASGWADQLGHQLPVLPGFETFWEELVPFFEWLNAKSQINKLTDIQPQERKQSIFDIQTLGPNHPKMKLLDCLQFCSINRLCAEIHYLQEDKQKKLYTVEPYSLRISDEKHLVLHCLDYKTKEIMVLPLERILTTHYSTIHFLPAYQIDFMPRFSF
jgi:predicted nucleotidyltransferase component of viral defense system